MNEVIRVNEWLYTVLAADSDVTDLVGTRIYDGLAPRGATYPVIIFNFLTGSDVMAVGSIRVMNSGLYQVKAVAQATSYADVSPVADAIDSALHRASGSVGDGAILACRREQPIVYIEQVNDLQYRHMGGLYRIQVQGS